MLDERLAEANVLLMSVSQAIVASRGPSNNTEYLGWVVACLGELFDPPEALLKDERLSVEPA